MGMIDRWLDEKYNEGLDQGISQGISQGIKQGLDQGIEQGVDQGARQLALGLLLKKFGSVPASVTERVQAAHADWLRQLTEQILTARSVEELDLS